MTSNTTAPITLPCQRPGLILDSGPSGHSVSDPATGVVHVLNETALALWELCDGLTNPQEMVAAVAVLFSCGPEVAERDVNRTLSEFDRVGLIEWRKPTEVATTHETMGGTGGPTG